MAIRVGSERSGHDRRTDDDRSLGTQVNSEFVGYCVLSYLVLLVLLPISASLSAENVCAPADIRCPAGQYRLDDQYMGRYPDLEFSGVSRVHFCRKESDRNIVTPIRDTRIVGTDPGCGRIFEGVYSGASRFGIWTVFWPNNVRRSVLEYGSGGELLSRKDYQENGRELFLNDENLAFLKGTIGHPSVLFDDAERVAREREGLLGKPTAQFSIQVDQEDRENQAGFSRPMVRICDNSPEGTFDLEKLYSFFRTRNIQLAYNAVTSRSVIFISTPSDQKSNGEIEFYNFYLNLDSCSIGERSRTCGISVLAQRKAAFVRNGTIELATARNTDDQITAALVNIALEIVQHPTIWCSWVARSTPGDLLRGLFGRF
jgi:hypothetical protein